MDLHRFSMDFPSMGSMGAQPGQPAWTDCNLAEYLIDSWDAMEGRVLAEQDPCNKLVHKMITVSLC